MKKKLKIQKPKDLVAIEVPGTLSSLQTLIHNHFVDVIASKKDYTTPVRTILQDMQDSIEFAGFLDGHINSIARKRQVAVYK